MKARLAGRGFFQDYFFCIISTDHMNTPTEVPAQAELNNLYQPEDIDLEAVVLTPTHRAMDPKKVEELAQAWAQMELGKFTKSSSITTVILPRTMRWLLVGIECTPRGLLNGNSSKPELEAYELIERMYPDLPKIELFAARQARPGWACWGDRRRFHPRLNRTVKTKTAPQVALRGG